MPPKSKPGEGIVIIVDVGPGVRASTENTFYSQAKECLIHILQRKIFADKCKDMVGIVLLNTDKTKNKLAKDDQYQHITVLAEPKFVDWDLISLAKNLPRGNSSADWLDSIIVAMDLLHDPDGIMFDTKKIVLMTDFSGDISDDQMDTIISGLKTMGIEFNVIGPSIEDDDGDEDDDVNMDDPSSSNSRVKKKAHMNWNGKLKSSRQMAAECLIKRIVAEVDGIICSFEEAIPQLIFFEKKSQRSSNWNAMLDVGENFKLPVTGRIKIRRATPATWKKVYVEDENALVISETSYHKKDENQTVVHKEDVISGFRYGTTLVPFGEEDAKLKYSCDAQGAVLSVLGFTKSSNVPQSMRSGDQVLVVTAREEDEHGAVALSAIIQALKELDMVAITRKVYRKNSNPVIGALYPDITSDYECLIWIGLPFQEEYQEFVFPSLARYEKQITDEQRDAMDELLTDMELACKDDEDDEEELDPTVVVNPQLQHYFNCLTHRAINPDELLPPPQQHILDILAPPAKQREVRDRLTEKLKFLFPTQIIKDYKQKKVDLFAGTDSGVAKASTSNGSSTTLTSSDLTSITVKNISTATPVQDFMAMLTGEQPNYPDICSKMSEVILQLAESLSGDVAVDNILASKVIEALKTFRKETTYIDPNPFNDFIRHFKQLVKARGFSHLWEIIVEDKLGLISVVESLKSKLTAEEAEQFLQMEEETKEVPVEVNNEADYDDMLDDF